MKAPNPAKAVASRIEEPGSGTDAGGLLGGSWCSGQTGGRGTIIGGFVGMSVAGVVDGVPDDGGGGGTNMGIGIGASLSGGGKGVSNTISGGSSGCCGGCGTRAEPRQ